MFLVADQPEMTYKGLFILGEEPPINVIGLVSIKAQESKWTSLGFKALPEHLTTFGEPIRFAFLSAQTATIGYSQIKEYPDEEDKIKESILRECVSITEAMIRKADLLIERNEQTLIEIERIKAEAQAKGF